MIWAQKFAVGVVVLGTGYKAAAFREVVCPSRRTSRSECVKNMLIGRETEHHQSDGSRAVALLAFAPSNKEDEESFADLRDQVIHAHQTLLTSAVGICQTLTNCSKYSFIQMLENKKICWKGRICFWFLVQKRGRVAHYLVDKTS